MDIRDYFDKHGFGSGQYDGIAWQQLYAVLDGLNAHLKPLGYYAEAYDPGSAHNNCRIRFRHLASDKLT